MRTRRKILLCAILVLVLLGLGFHFWLSTGPLRRSVLQTLSKHYAGLIELDRVTVRFNRGLVLRGLRFHASPNETSPVACEIPQLDLHGSVWNLYRGQFEADKVTVQSPKLRVIQQADGQWTFDPPFRMHDDDKLTTAVPTDVLDASIEFVARRPDESKTVRHIELNVRPSNPPGSWSIGTKVNDPVFGSWTSHGTFDIKTSQFSAQPVCPKLSLSPELIRSLGRKFDALRQNCNFAGEVAIEANLQGSLDGKVPLNYQIFLDPRNARLGVEDIPEPIRDVAGRIEITPNEVRVHGLAGDLANGQIVVSGSLLRGEQDQLTLSLDMRHVDVRRLVPSGPSADELRSVIEAADSLSGKFQVHGFGDPDTWAGSFDGSLEVHSSQEAQSIPLHLTLSQGLLKIEQFEWRWNGGHLHLNASIPIRANRDIQGTVRLESIPVESAFRLAAQEVHDIDGLIGGDLAFRVPMKLRADIRDWKLTGPIRLQALHIGDLDFDWITGSLSAQNGTAILSDAAASTDQLDFTGSVTVSLFDQDELSVSFQMKPVSLAELVGQQYNGGRNDFIRGQLELIGTVSGRLVSDSIVIRGDGLVRRLGFGDVDIGDTRFKYEWSEDGFRVTGLDVPVFGGRFRGSGRWRSSFANDAAGGGKSPEVDIAPTFSLLGSFENIDFANLNNALDLQAFDLHGAASGELQLQLNPNSPEPLRSIRASGRVASKRLMAGGMPIDVSADFEFDGTTCTVSSLSATTPAGRVNGSATLELSARQRVLNAELQSTNLNLFKLAAFLPTAAPLPLIAGTSAGQLSLQCDLASGDVVGKGAGRIQSLAIPGLPMIESLLVRRFEIRDDTILVPEYQATLWGGTSTGSCRIDLQPNADKLIEVTIIKLDHVELSQISATWPSAAGNPSGKLSGTGKLAIVGSGPRQSVLGSGDYTVDSAVYAGLPLGRTVGSIEAFDGATHEFIGGRVQPKRNGTAAKASDQHFVIRVREARPARGTLQGTVLVGVTGILTYDSFLKFSGLDLATTLQTLFASRHAVSGVLSGEMRLLGSERGQDDARGEMWFRVDNGNLWRFPVLAVFLREAGRVLNRLLNLNLWEQGAQTALARRVTLDHGVVQVHEFWIAGDVGRLFGEGTITLDGRIDLDFVGNFDTGLPKNVPLLGQLDDLVKFAQKRMLKIHLSGTLSDPVAVVVPIQNLTEPAERFLRGVITGTLFDDDRTSRTGPR
jgi:hypothetical protein